MSPREAGRGLWLFTVKPGISLHESLRSSGPFVDTSRLDLGARSTLRIYYTVKDGEPG